MTKTALMPEPPACVQAYLELVRCHEALSAQSAQFFREFGLTEQQYNVLRILYVRDEGDGVPCSEIGARLLNRVPDITRLLDRLEKAGWVTRRRCTHDRRVVRAQLTDEGQALVERIHEPLLRSVDERMAGLSDEELERLTELLSRLRPPGDP